MDFIWNDGGRAACGFVGLAGDCVTRSIAIATSALYRDVYGQLGEAALSSPRNGVPVTVAEKYLSANGWQCVKEEGNQPFRPSLLPKGIVIVHVSRSNGRRGHFTTVIDHVVHDTWNPTDEADYKIQAYWINPTLAAKALDGTHLSAVGARATSSRQFLNQNEFEKILKRLRALDSTASNSASTEGEKHNALRMMQDLMLRHNLTRDDIEEDDNVQSMSFTRRVCPLNTARACSWQVMLAGYVTRQIFPMVQFYMGRRGPRTLFWFYGPRQDVDNCLSLFKELLLTIAVHAKLLYGGCARGSGASYCEGYVTGLPCDPRSSQTEATSPTKAAEPGDEEVVSQYGLIHTRMLKVQETAKDWLELECGIQLARSYRSGRYQNDPAAQKLGKMDGATQQVSAPGMQKRLTDK